MKDKILEEYKKGNVVIATFEGLKVTKLKDLIKQPTDGLLYDLNRIESVVLTFLPDPKWVNDYAVSQVIRELKSQLEEKKSPQLIKMDKLVHDNLVEICKEYPNDQELGQQVRKLFNK